MYPTTQSIRRATMKKITLYPMALFLFLLSLNTMSYAGTFASPPSPLKDTAIKAFSFNLLLSVYDFKPDNMQENFQSAAKNFSSNGWQTFMKALLDSKVLNSVKKNNYLVTSTPLSPPEILEKGLYKGVYFWKVGFPAMIVFKNDTYQQVQYVTIKLHINYINEQLKTESFIATKSEPLMCKKTSPEIVVKAVDALKKKK